MAASLASTQTSEPSVVTRYSRPSRYCMDSADPPPVPSFHRRVPSWSKQYTEDEASPAKTNRPPGEVAQEYTALSQAYVASIAPVAFDSRWTARCAVPAYTASSSCQPNRTPPRVGVCHNSPPPSGA